MTSTDGYVVGLDIGATSTRSIVAGLDGHRHGTGRASGGNPSSHPPEQAAARVADALRQALSGVDPAQVRAGVLGMAGASQLADPTIAALFTQAWKDVGLSCPMTVATDAEAGFAAGTAAADGVGLVAGTGTAAVRIQGRRMAGIFGGHGWLLGDEGSAFWLGREALRSTLLTAERRLPHTGFVDTVVEELLGPEASWDDLRRQLISLAKSEPPIRLARFAPLVTAAAAAGDEVAADIVERAAQHLADLVLAAGCRDSAEPVALIGSLTALGNPVGDALRATLAAHGIGPVHLATDGAAGAAWLAIMDIRGDDPAAELAQVRARLFPEVSPADA